MARFSKIETLSAIVSTGIVPYLPPMSANGQRRAESVLRRRDPRVRIYEPRRIRPRGVRRTVEIRSRRMFRHGAGRGFGCRRPDGGAVHPARREFHRWPDVRPRTSRRSATGGSFPTRRVAVRSPRSARRRRPAATCVKFFRRGASARRSSKHQGPDAVEHVDGYRRSQADRRKSVGWFRCGDHSASAWARNYSQPGDRRRGIGIRSPANAARRCRSSPNTGNNRN